MHHEGRIVNVTDLPEPLRSARMANYTDKDEYESDALSWLRIQHIPLTAKDDVDPDMVEYRSEDEREQQQKDMDGAIQQKRSIARGQLQFKAMQKRVPEPAVAGWRVEDVKVEDVQAFRKQLTYCVRAAGERGMHVTLDVSELGTGPWSAPGAVDDLNAMLIALSDDQPHP